MTQMTQISRLILAVATLCLFATSLRGQGPSAIALQPDRVFDGAAMHTGWTVIVRGERIEAAGPSASTPVPSGARTIALPGTTLMPGLIEGHSHLLLHPYNETTWNDQVLREPEALRVARAVNHARATLDAGFTTVRDLGTEGAGYSDAGLKAAIEQRIIPGPRMVITSRAIVATGSYAPRGFDPRRDMPQGADWIKVYADYRWGPNGESRPTFTEQELRTIVEVAGASGRPVVAHASTAEGMRRAVVAGVRTIDHGDGGTAEVFRLMRERGV